MSDTALSYNSIEIKSYLPSGWVLLDDAPTDDRKGVVWAARVLDGADTEWTLEVTGRSIDEHGRLGALQHAIDRVYREALG